MSYTLDENGTALTETQEGVTLPVDCSFEKVNDWIHGIDVQFEEVQALCLGIASENDRLREQIKALSSTIALIDMNVRKKDWHRALEHCLASRERFLDT